MSRTVRLGAFIVATLAILAIGIFIIGGQKFLFNKTYSLKANFADVAGLTAGADVLVGGVHSGTVRSIELPHKASGQVTITLELNQSTHEIIKQDSVASIQTEGLLGNQFVAVSFGTDGKPDVKDGDTISTVPPLQMGALLDKANGLLASGQDAMDNITKVTAHLNSVSAKIDGGSGTVGALINDKALYSNLNQTASTARSTVSAAQAGLLDFQDNMQALKHNFLLKGYFKSRGYEDSSELEKYAVVALPQANAVKEFTLSSKQIFDKQDSAKLKDEKAFNAAGEYLATSEFSVAIIEVSTGLSGDSDKDMLLAQARALVVHDYLAEHFGFDDTKLRTLALGKQIDAQHDNKAEPWGHIRILIYPTGTAIPAAITPAATAATSQPAAATNQKPLQ